MLQRKVLCREGAYRMAISSMTEVSAWATNGKLVDRKLSPGETGVERRADQGTRGIQRSGDVEPGPCLAVGQAGLSAVPGVCCKGSDGSSEADPSTEENGVLLKDSLTAWQKLRDDDKERILQTVQTLLDRSNGWQRDG